MEKELAQAVYSFALQLYEKGYIGVCYMDNGYKGPVIPGMLNYLESKKERSFETARDGVNLTIFLSQHPEGEPNFGIQLRPQFREGKFQVKNISVFETDHKNTIVRLAGLENTCLEKIPDCPEMILKLRHIPRLQPAGFKRKGGRVAFKKDIHKRRFKR